MGLPRWFSSKESACNADQGSIPGSGRSPGEKNGYPFQYSCLENSMDYTVLGVTKSWTCLNNFHFTYVLLGASPVAKFVKGLPAMQGTRVQSLGQEDPLEKGMTNHSSILPWRIPWTREPGWLQSLDHKESDTTE